MEDIQVQICYVKEDHAIVLVLQKPCSFAEASEFVGRYLKEPHMVTWNETIEGLVVMTISLQYHNPEVARRFADRVNSDALFFTGPPPVKEGSSIDLDEEVEDVLVLGEVAGAELLPHELPGHGPPTHDRLRRPYAESQQGPKNLGSAQPWWLTGAIPKADSQSPEKEAKPTWDEGEEWDWDPYLIQVLAPYGAAYEDLVTHFSKFGPVDYCREEQTRANADGVRGHMCYIRYRNPADAQDAFENSQRWRPRLVRRTKEHRPTTTCWECGMLATAKFMDQHQKFCRAKRALQQRTQNKQQEARTKAAEAPKPTGPPKQPKSAERSRAPEGPRQRPAEQPKPENSRPARASEQPKAQGSRKVQSIRPPPMATGPLVGLRLYAGYLSVFNHRFQMTTIQDQGQELMPPQYDALELQLREVYGSIDMAMQ